jgi:ADP-ribosylglycohydrolase
MLGAIAGDVIGSVYERLPVRSTDFPLFPRGARFTDDTVLTVATAEAILQGGDYREAYQSWGRRYPAAGYGPGFKRWLMHDDPPPLGSMGNGSAMRVSPVGFAFNSVDEVLREAERSAIVSHDHPEGIKGAQAVALAVYLARTGATKGDIRREITDRFAYNLDRTIAEIRPTYRIGVRFDMSCEGSVPEAILAFLDGESYEDAVRLAISLAGDSDTQACIAGAIAEAYFHVIPEKIISEVRSRLTSEMISVLEAFASTYPLQPAP